MEQDHVTLGELLSSWFSEQKVLRSAKGEAVVQEGWQQLVMSLYETVRMPEFVSVTWSEENDAPDAVSTERLIFAVRKTQGPLGLLQLLGTCSEPPEDLEYIAMSGEAATFLHVHITMRAETGATIVNAMPISTMARIASDVTHIVPTWAASSEHVETVGTQAVQIWHSRDGAGLGWERIAAEAVHHRPVENESSGPTLGGFVEPFDTWADLTVTKEFEITDEAYPVGAVSYFCSVLPHVESDDFGGPWDGPFSVLQNTLGFLDSHVKELWPNAGSRYPSAFDWEREFVAPAELSAWPPDLARLLTMQVAKSIRDPVIFARKERVWKLRSQEQLAALGPRIFVSANADPANAYTLNVPGSTKFRVWPGDTGVGNVTFAGDWTRTILNAGCVEAAVVSGMLAAESSLLQLGLSEEARGVRDQLDGMDGRSWPTARSRV